MMRRLLILLLALWPASAWAQFPMVGTLWPCSAAGVVTASHVQGATASSISASSNNTYTLSFASTVVTGHGVMGMIRYGNSSTLSSITDDAGNSYTLVNTINDNPGNFAVINFYNTSVTGTPKTLSFVFGAGQTFYNLRVAMDEYSNVSSFDTSTAQELTNPGTGANALTSGSITTATNQELIYATVTDVPGLNVETITAGSGYTLQQFGDGSGDITGASGSQVQSAAGVISGTFTTNQGTAAYVIGVIAFRPTAAQSTCNVPPPTNTFIVAKNGNDSWSGLLAAPNASATDGPFLTPTRCRAAMAGSATTKTCSLRAGTYSLPAAIILSSSDSGETWQFYAPDGYNTAVLDGSSTVNFFSLSGVSNLTINGIKMQNAIDNGIGTPSNNARNDSITIENCDIGFNTSTSLPTGGFSEMIVLGNTTNAKILNNYVHDVASQGITLFAYNATDSVDGGLISGNVVLRAVQTTNDGGAIYINMRNSVPNGVISRVSIINNYVRDYGNAGVQAEGIYLDDDSSHVTVTGNVIAPPNKALVSGIINDTVINGGYDNQFKNNIIDLFRNNIAINAEGPCGQGGNGTVPCSGPSAPSIFSGNIVLTKFAGNSAVVDFDCSACAYDQNATSSAAWISISGNTYHNYGGGQELTNGNVISDASPTHADPGCSGVTYTLSNPPVGWTPIVGGWGPPGFVVTDTQNPPNRSCP